MVNILRIAKKEITFLIATPPVLLVLLVAPIAYPFFYNYLYVQKFETGVPCSVSDLDRSRASRSLIRSLDATEQLRITGVVPHLISVRDSLEKGSVQGVIVIPQGFERDLLRHRRPVLRVYVNTTRFMIAVDVGKGISEAIAKTGRDILAQTFSEAGLTRELSRRMAQPLLLRSESLANTLECYGDFIIPALLLLILQQSLFVGTAAASARRSFRERGKPFSAEVLVSIAGRTLPYFLLYGVYASLFFSVQYKIWNIPFNGSAAVVAALTAIHLATIIIMGFLFGSLCTSRLTALVIGMFSSYPIFLLSGLAWPATSMPQYLRMLSYAFPSTHYFPAVLSAARMNAGWSDVSGAFAMVVLLGAVFLSGLLMVNKFRPPRPHCSVRRQLNLQSSWRD
jgi:ABC-2 type transport system permease protein